MNKVPIHLVLRHDHVLGRKKLPIHASVTQVDLHDFCRLASTYALAGVHCVTELDAQRSMVAEMTRYWEQGAGRRYNPDRSHALAKLQVHGHFDDAIAAVTDDEGREPVLVATSAQPVPEKVLEFNAFWDRITPLGRPVMLQFGTSWGLSSEQMSRCEWVLPPVEGRDGYNHLSVRCAAAIIVDRLMSASMNRS